MVEHVQPMPDGTLAAPARGMPHARRLARRFGWITREALLFPVVAIYVISLAGLLPGELFSDSWLAVLGGREVAHQGLPSHETLTMWAHGAQWVDQQWLGQLAFYGLYSVGGIKLAALLHVAAVGSAFVLAIAAARWRGASVRSVCWISLPTIVLLFWGSWNARTQSLAFPLFVGLVWLLIRDARSPSRGVFFVFPLLALWANIHGTAILGAGLVALAGACYGFERRKQPVRGWAPRGALMIVAPFACVLASPYATSLPGYYRSVMFNSSLRGYIIEWRPTTLSIETVPFFLLAALAIWLIGRDARRLLLTEKALLAVTLVMGLQTMRSVVWFAVLALILLPTALDVALPANTRAARFAVLNRALITMSLVGIVVALAAVASKPASWFEQEYPQGVLAAVARVEAEDPGVRVFASEPYSDWLLLRRPELRGRIAYDVRFELLSHAQYTRSVNTRRLVVGWKHVVAPYGLFVLRAQAERSFGQALLREPGARPEYRGHGVLVVSRPVGGSAK